MKSSPVADERSVGISVQVHFTVPEFAPAASLAAPEDRARSQSAGRQAEPAGGESQQRSDRVDSEAFRESPKHRRVEMAGV